MSQRATKKNIGETKSKKLKKELTVDKAKTEIVNKIIAEISDLLDDQTQGGDSTDGVITLLEDIFQPISDVFKELIGKSKDKKNFIGGLIKIFTILLSTKTPALTKIEKVIRTSVKVALELWPEQKQLSEDYIDLRLWLHQVKELKIKT